MTAFGLRAMKALYGRVYTVLAARSNWMDLDPTAVPPSPKRSSHGHREINHAVSFAANPLHRRARASGRTACPLFAARSEHEGGTAQTSRLSGRQSNGKSACN